MSTEINSYQKKCNRLKETCQVLQKDFVRLVKKGEEKKDFYFIFKATGIKRKCEDKELEMKNLQDKVTSLKPKRQKMSCDSVFTCSLKLLFYLHVSCVVLSLFIFHGYFVSKKYNYI